MQVIIKSIEVSQFKGVSQFTANLNEINNILAGSNRTGKTTVGANAITWCLFGKDIYNRSNYEIMPLDVNGNMVEHMEPTVVLVFDVDGQKKTFKRVMKQKWVKKRGTSESTFDGSCTTDYFVDDVPVKQKEYNEAVSALINEDLFRVITLPTHFPSLDWKIRRQMIIDIVGDVDMDGIMARDEFIALKAAMEGKSIEDYRKMVAHQKKQLKTDLERIPAKISAAKEFIPEVEPDYAALTKLISDHENDIAEIENQITDKSSVLQAYQKKLQERAKQIQDLEKSKSEFVINHVASKQQEIDDLQDEKSMLQGAINDKKIELSKLINDITLANGTIQQAKNQLASLGKQREDNKNAYLAKRALEFVAPEDDRCPTCGHVEPRTPEQITELEAAFNNNKANQMQAILDKNNPLIEQCRVIEEETIPEVEKNIASLQQSKSQLESQIANMEKESGQYISKIAGVNITAARENAKNEPGYIEIKKKIDALNAIDEEAPKVDVTEFNTEKATIRKEIESLQKQLNSKDSIDQARANIKKYEQEGKELANRIAKLEGLEYSTELLEKAIAEDVESRINNRLSGGVTFKMFIKQNNEGIKPTCDILVDGVPYFSANTASQIQAGIVIINLLSNYYDIYAPIIVDNRESVVELPETKSQTINLVVDKSLNTLTLKN